MRVRGIVVPARAISRTTRRVLLAAMLGFITALGLTACTAKTDSLVVAYSPFESTALVWVADDQGLFTDNGLDVTFRKYDTGAAALDAALSGEADIVVGTSEFPVVGKALQGLPAAIVATIARSELIYFVGRKDRGIEDVGDLAGKRVGTTRETIADYFLGRSLELDGVNSEDVTVVDLKTPGEWVDALVSGDVDAVCTAEPYASSAADGLGGNGVKWSAHSDQPLFALAISRDGWIDEHADLLQEFLQSLVDAEEYAAGDPAQAKVILQTRLGLTPEYVEEAWARNDFRLSLDESLIAAMASEARWLIRSNLTTVSEVPAFLDRVHEDALAKVKPSAVHIIR